jgi:Zn-dependent protease with chaperone function
MSSEWYLMSNHVVKGPLSAEEMRDLAQAGELSPEDRVRKGDGLWVPANRVKGLFDVGSDETTREGAPGSAPLRGLTGVTSIRQCISREERKKRGGAILISSLIWLVLALLTVTTFGVVLVLWFVSWLITRIMSEYNVRKLQAVGTAATPDQFPEVAEALSSICRQFKIDHEPRVIILNMGEVNAFALRFARKKVIVLLSEVLEGILDQPGQMRFILAHELAHLFLDDTFGGKFLIYRPAAFKSGRELTCDNTGCAAAGDLESAKTALKRVGVGNKLHSRLNEQFLETEAKYIYSGITGWLLKQYLTYPPLGRRISNVTSFYNAHK